MGTSQTGERNQTLYKIAKVDGLDIFYREAGPRDAPTILLHGFPTSSHMFRNLIIRLSDKFHLIAPDYPGYGNSSAPPVDAFDYSFDHLAEIIEKFAQHMNLRRFSMYLQDYGAPIGFRIAAKHPDWIESLIIQNGNAYEEGTKGLKEFWEPMKAYWHNRTRENEAAVRKFLTIDSTKWQYTQGYRNTEAISSDNWLIDQPLLDRPGNDKIQLQMFYSYRTNPPLYPQWQVYFQEHQPPPL
jgi:pimeloyl-ACP methyl ester carboxylesterase